MNYRKILFLFVIILSLPTMAFSQSLNDEFTKLIEESNRYQEYKVVKINTLNSFQQKMNDTLSFLNNEINEQALLTSTLQARIDSLEKKVNSTEEALQISKQKEDGIFLFGMLLKKSTYNTILWSIIGLLLLLMVILFIRQKNSLRVTREANEKLLETESEFESHRQRALEREQQLRRKLQDEINKQKNA